MRNLNSYTLGDNYVSPDKRLSQMLKQQGSNSKPSYSWQETVGRIAQQLLGNYIGDEDQGKQNKAFDAMTGLEPDSTSIQPNFTPDEIVNYKAETNTRPLPHYGLEPDEQDRDADLAQSLINENKIPTLSRQMSQPQISEESFGPEQENLPAVTPVNIQPQRRTEQPEIDGSGWNNLPDLSEVHRVNTYAGVPTPDPRDQMAKLMQESQSEQLNEKMNPRDFSMQQLRGLENNPYAKRILAQMMMQNADRDYAAGLAQTARGFAQEDATTNFGRKKELAQIKIDSMKTKEQRNFLQAQNDPKFKEFLAATGAGNTPNAVKEYEYYTKLKTPAEQQNYMILKRAAQIRNLGDRVESVNPTNPSGPPLSSSMKGVPPQQTPEHKALVKESETTAKSVAEAKFNLPKIISTADRHLALLDRVTKTDPITGKRTNHPGFQSLYGTAIPGVDGATAPFARFIPGSDTKDLSAIVEQIGGSNFLLAFESLKGGGQITEVEGKQAKLAISALQDINISEQEAFRQYDTLRTILAKGVANAKDQAQAGEYNMTITNAPDGNNKGRRTGEPNNGGPLSPDEKKRLQELRRKARGQ